jgi:endonuclease III
MSTNCKPTSARVLTVVKALDEVYVQTRLGNKSNPLDELVYAMLSGQTREDRYQHVFRDFKSRFPRWDMVSKASRRSVRSSIWNAGLADQKSGYIKAIVRRLENDFGEVSLRALKQMGDVAAERYLLSLRGVGVKTARCVLMYSLDRHVFPADIHCLRIMRRLGWIESVNRSPRTVADLAQACVPPPVRKKLHIRLVQHGRAICRPRPKCDLCCIKGVCRWTGQ